MPFCNLFMKWNDPCTSIHTSLLVSASRTACEQDNRYSKLDMKVCDVLHV